MEKEMSNAVIKIDEIKKSLALITKVGDARKLLAIAEGLLIATRKEYKATEKIGEVKEDRDKAYGIALKAGELRLLAEAKLGELIKIEQESGRLASQGRPGKGNTEVTFLKNVGLSKMESFRTQRIDEYKDLIPQVVAKAIERGDIPTRKDLEHAIFQDKRKRVTERPPSPAEIELMPVGDNRKIKIKRDQSKREWTIAVGRNRAGEKLKENLQEMKNRERFIKIQKGIDEINEKSEKLRKEADRLKKLAWDEWISLCHELKIALEDEYGEAYAYIRTFTFWVNEVLDKQISALPSDEDKIKFLFKRPDGIEGQSEGHWGDVLLSRFAVDGL